MLHRMHVAEGSPRSVCGPAGDLFGCLGVGTSVFEPVERALIIVTVLRLPEKRRPQNGASDGKTLAEDGVLLQGWLSLPLRTRARFAHERLTPPPNISHDALRRAAPLRPRQAKGDQ